jgi:hypothetical protein
MLGDDGATYLLRHDAGGRWELTMYETSPALKQTGGAFA